MFASFFLLIFFQITLFAQMSLPIQSSSFVLSDLLMRERFHVTAVDAKTGISGKKKARCIDRCRREYKRSACFRNTVSINRDSRNCEKHVKRSYRGMMRQTYKYYSQQTLSLQGYDESFVTPLVRMTWIFQAPHRCQQRLRYNSPNMINLFHLFYPIIRERGM